MAGVLVVLGTRPEAIKLAPVIQALRARDVAVTVCATAQHRELLDQALGPFGFSADIDLDLMRPGLPVGHLIGDMLSALDPVIVAAQPDGVIVQGDTATALAGAQAAYYRGVPVAHVEAGLRTGDLGAPHPEEGNRRMIGAIAALHFAPTSTAAEALLREGIAAHRIHLTGNTVVDALHDIRDRLAAEPALAGAAKPHLAAIDGRRLIVVTCHRRESFAAAPEIARALGTLAQRGDVRIVVPLHPNPAIRAPLVERLQGQAGIALIEPLDFPAFVALLAAAELVLTDSGGVQEEAPVLGVPVLVMRNTTERPEAVAAGTARLIGTRASRIVAETTLLLDNPELRARMAHAHSPFGDGRAAERIADIIAERYGYADAEIASAE